MKTLTVAFTLFQITTVCRASDSPSIPDAKSKTATVACHQLTSYNATLTNFPNSTEYLSELAGYWVLQNSDIYPSCRFTPVSAVDVSSAIRVIVKEKCHFAISSGRHSVVVGGNNIHDGVTIDFNAHMRSIELNEQSGTVRVQFGAKWAEVYKFLEPRGWMVAGGRLSDIGVGGLLLGGGISYYGPRKGWASDSVIGATVVLADGSVVRATPDPNSDLFWAIRGGGNRYGIVVEFELRAFRYTSPTFGGTILLDPSNITEATRRAVAFNDAGSLQDDGLSVAMPISWSATSPNRTAIYYIVDSYGRNFSTDTSSPAYPLVQLAAAPLGTTDLKLYHVSTRSEILFETDPASRYAQSVITLPNDIDALTAVVDVFEGAIKPLLAADSTLRPAVMHQLIPAATFNHMTDSPIRLENGPVIVHFLSYGWDDAAKDEFYKNKLQEIHQNVEETAIKLGALREWKYWNYAAGWQDVYRGDGKEAYKRLKTTVDRYDPDRVFWTLQARSFDYF